MAPKIYQPPSVEDCPETPPATIKHSEYDLKYPPPLIDPKPQELICPFPGPQWNNYKSVIPPKALTEQREAKRMKIETKMKDVEERRARRESERLVKAEEAEAEAEAKAEAEASARWRWVLKWVRERV